MRKLIISAALMLLVQTGYAGSDWGYIRDSGPDSWGKNYPACLDKLQSPIDIESAVPDSKNKLAFHYQPAEFKLVLNPHNLYVYSIQPDADFVEFNGKQYQLQSFHFHVPAEHKVRGVLYPMELQLVHEDSQGNTLVVSVFLQNSDNKNRNISEIYIEPMKNRKILTETDLATIIPASSKYFNYTGSLTTPPCSQPVTWIVMERPMPIADKQIKYFKDHVIPANSRPIQPMDGRVVLESG